MKSDSLCLFIPYFSKHSQVLLDYIRFKYQENTGHLPFSRMCYFSGCLTDGGYVEAKSYLIIADHQMLHEYTNSDEHHSAAELLFDLVDYQLINFLIHRTIDRNRNQTEKYDVDFNKTDIYLEINKRQLMVSNSSQFSKMLKNTMTLCYLPRRCFLNH